MRSVVALILWLLASAAALACTPIASVPYTITTTGVYCLTGAVGTSENLDGITVNAHNVTIDGQGFTMGGRMGADTTSRGIIAVDKKSVVIRDIRIVGFMTSVLIGTTDVPVAGTGAFSSVRQTRDIWIEGVTADNPTFQGFHVAADNVTIKDNVISGVGPTTVYPHAFATGIDIKGNACEVSGNRIMMGDPTGNGENVGIGGVFVDGCVIGHNVIYMGRYHDYARNYGIWVRPGFGGLPLIHDNLVAGGHYGYGPFGMYRDNIATNVACALFTVRQSDPDAFIDMGGNSARSSLGTPRPGPRECPDDPEEAATRFFANPIAETAYAVAMAWGETSPYSNRADAVAWIMVAAHLGHSIAISQVAGLSDPQSVIAAATAKRDAILAQL